ncbi:hypothetical protein [Halobacterium noricense]|uniref:hypothetical protein n=1 Tax=Halobacterium noricense TaxID=223182 RepID=UPI001E561D1E|nr:hypothetical protein [Halobacterium noricense]UHH27268.1 hypothetical protein LT974_17655 [Halobacterium noricense]
MPTDAESSQQVNQDDVSRYLGDDFDPSDVDEFARTECDHCGRKAATGAHGCCRWCRGYLHGVAVGIRGDGA